MFGEFDKKIPLRRRGFGVQLQAKTIQTITNNTLTALTFDTLVRDDFRTVDLTNFNTRITVPFQGWYIFSGFIAWNGNSSSGYRAIELRLNGGSTAPMFLSTGASNGDSGPTINCACGYYCNAGDYVELKAFQNSGGSRVTFNYPPFANFSAFQVGP